METDKPKRNILRIIFALVGILFLFIVVVIYPLAFATLRDRVIVAEASFFGALGLVLMGIAVIKNSINTRIVFVVGAVIVVLNQFVDVYRLWESLLGSGANFSDVLSTWFDSMYNFLLPVVTVLTFGMFAVSGLFRFSKFISWLAIAMGIIYLAALCVSIYLWDPISYFWPHTLWYLGLLFLSVSYIMFLMQVLKANGEESVS